VSIDSFLNHVAKNGGMSFSNNFLVAIEGAPVAMPGELSQGDALSFMCDEAQLPNVNTATGSINGLYSGLGNLDYPHTRVFTELQLGFMLDANLSILKFLNGWFNNIFSDEGSGPNRVTRLAYRDNYAADIKITKTENGPDSTTQRQPITYVMEKAYPYAIDAIPLQFGSSQITKVTAQFKYQRHYTIDRDVLNVADKARIQNTSLKVNPRKSNLDKAQSDTGNLDLTNPYGIKLPVA
jgi:hypothetical protein